MLVLHLTGAAVAAVLVISSLLAVLFRRANAYRPLALSLAGLGVLQIVSGALLAYVSGGTWLSFCVKVAVYLAVLTATEVALLVATHRSRRRAFATR